MEKQKKPRRRFTLSTVLDYVRESLTHEQEPIQGCNKVLSKPTRGEAPPPCNQGIYEQFLADSRQHCDPPPYQGHSH